MLSGALGASLLGNILAGKEINSRRRSMSKETRSRIY